jgi:hypothetical protein
VVNQSPEDVVRMLFETPRRGDDERLITLLGMDGGPPGRRVEVQAHRFVRAGDDVIAFGRVRVFQDGALSDSPAAWRITLREGRVKRIESFAGSEADVAGARSIAAA